MKASLRFVVAPTAEQTEGFKRFLAKKYDTVSENIDLILVEDIFKESNPASGIFRNCMLNAGPMPAEF